MGFTWLGKATKVFPAVYSEGTWHWAYFPEVMDLLKLESQVLLDQYANVSPGWNLITLGADNTRKLWTAIWPQESTDFYVPIGWVKCLTEHTSIEQLLLPEKQAEILAITFRKQGYFIVRMTVEEREERILQLNPLIEALKKDFQVGIHLNVAAYNPTGMWSAIDVVVYNHQRWEYRIRDMGTYSNGLDIGFHFSGSIRLDRPHKQLAELPVYLHPLNTTW